MKHQFDREVQAVLTETRMSRVALARLAGVDQRVFKGTMTREVQARIEMALDKMGVFIERFSWGSIVSFPLTVGSDCDRKNVEVLDERAARSCAEVESDSRRNAAGCRDRRRGEPRGPGARGAAA